MVNTCSVTRPFRFDGNVFLDAGDVMKFAELCLKHGCDKESSHHYGCAYDWLLQRIALMPSPKILEIGIYKAAGLRVLKEFFPNALIYAIDIDPMAVRLAPENVIAMQMDQGNTRQLNSLGLLAAGFDLIIDDGSHLVPHQKHAFEVLWPFVSIGGSYVIEDLETSLKRQHRHNPSGEETTLDMLLRMAKGNVHWGSRYRDKPPILSFYRELCCLTKME